MLQGTGAVHTRVGPQAMFAYLADPRHAANWFAGVAVEQLAPGPLRAGQIWRFVQGPGVARRSLRPIRMAVFAPPGRFVWETTLPRVGTNLIWDLTCAPTPAGGTTLQMTIRWRPGPLGWLAVLAATLVRRGALRTRAQQTAERARGAVEGAFPAPARRAPETSGGRDMTRAQAKRRRRR